MKKVTQEYVIQCINNERAARAMHREHNTDETWAEKQNCIAKTNDALNRYPGKVQMTKGLRF
jgi:hypothetical protein